MIINVQTMKAGSLAAGQIPLLASHVGADVEVAGDSGLRVREMVSPGANSPHVRAAHWRKVRVPSRARAPRPATCCTSRNATVSWLPAGGAVRNDN